MFILLRGVALPAHAEKQSIFIAHRFNKKFKWKTAPKNLKMLLDSSEDSGRHQPAMKRSWIK